MDAQKNPRRTVKRDNVVDHTLITRRLEKTRTTGAVVCLNMSMCSFSNFAREIDVWRLVLSFSWSTTIVVFALDDWFRINARMRSAARNRGSGRVVDDQRDVPTRLFSCLISFTLFLSYSL